MRGPKAARILSRPHGGDSSARPSSACCATRYRPHRHLEGTVVITPTGLSGRPAGYHPRTTSTLVSMRRVAKCARRFSDCTGLRRVRAADATGRRACEIVPRGAGFPSLHHRTVLPAQPRALPLHHLCYASCCTHHHPQHHHPRYRPIVQTIGWFAR